MTDADTSAADKGVVISERMVEETTWKKRTVRRAGSMMSIVDESPGSELKTHFRAVPAGEPGWVEICFGAFPPYILRERLSSDEAYHLADLIREAAARARAPVSGGDDVG